MQGMTKPILLYDLTSGTTSGLKTRPNLKMAAILKISKYLRFILTSDMERSLQIVPEKVVLMLMTSLMTSQRDVNLSLLHSSLNEIVIFSAI